MLLGVSIRGVSSRAEGVGVVRSAGHVEINPGDEWKGPINERSANSACVLFYVARVILSLLTGVSCPVGSVRSIFLRGRGFFCSTPYTVS